MQPSYSTRLTPQQLEEFAEMEADSSESGESGKMTILPLVNVSGSTMTEEETARQLTESLTIDADGAGKFVADADVIAAFRLLWQSDPTYCERQTASLREKSDNKRSFDNMVSAIKKEAKDAEKRRKEEERLYYQALNAANDNNTVEFPDLPDLSTPLYSGKYEYDGKKIYYTVETPEGSVTRTVFPHAAVPVCIYRNIDSHTEKIRLAFHNPSVTFGGWQYATVDRETLADVTRIKSLAKFGISINSDKAHNAMDYFTVLLDRNQASGAIPSKYSAARLGWMGDDSDPYRCFMPYDRARIEFDGDPLLEDKLRHFEKKGSLDTWLHVMAEQYRKTGGKSDSTPLRLAIAASLGSILMKPLGRQLFAVELWGATGTGKTVALQAAASCWGNPAAQNALISTLDTTAVGRERLYGFYGDLPVFMDELQTLKDYGNKTAAYNDLIMNHSGGEGRTRGSATDKLQTIEHWHNILLLTGEEPVTKENSSGGAKNRVIEVEIGDRLFDDPAAFVDVISENFGLVGEQWTACIKAKIADPQMWNEIRQSLNARTARITRLMHTDQKQAAAAAFLLEVDKLICRVLFDDYHIDPLEDEDIASFVKDSSAINTGDRAFDDVIAWVTENKPCFEEDAASWDEYSRGAARQCYGKIDEKNKRIVIIAAALRVFLENRGYDVKAVTKQWKNRGLLIYDNGRLQKQERINGLSVKTYSLKYDFDSILSG